MSVHMNRDGKHPIVAAQLAYLEETYGIPPGHVKATSTSSEVGGPITVTVTLLVQGGAASDPESTTVLDSAGLAYARVLNMPYRRDVPRDDPRDAQPDHLECPAHSGAGRGPCALDRGHPGPHMWAYIPPVAP